MSKSKTQWAYNDLGDDSDEYSDEGVSSEYDSSEEENMPRSRRDRDASIYSDSESDESEEDPALARVRERQAKILRNAKASKTGKKKPEAKKEIFKERKTDGKKSRKKKKISSDESSGEDEDRGEPIDDVDMERLVKEAMEGSQMSALHSLCWWRIVLDEAHMIKSRSSQTANAAFSLIGMHRWCLSGTPLQNRVGELYSLIRFLRIDPMAHYFCRAKVSQSLLKRRQSAARLLMPPPT